MIPEGTRRRRVLFCPPLFAPSVGGSQTLFADLARLWSEEGDAVIYAGGAPGSTGKRESRQSGAVRFFPVTPRRAPRLLGAASRRGSVRWRSALGFPHLQAAGLSRFLAHSAWAADGPFDLVVAGVLPHTYFLEPVARAARRWETPWMAIPLLHTGLLGTRPDRQVLGPAGAEILADARRVIGLTEAEVDPLVRRGVRRERIRVRPAALERAAFPPVSTSMSLPEKPYVLQAGALSKDKGTLTLLAAFSRLRSRHQELDLVLMGRPDGEVIRNLARLPVNLAGSVHVIREPPAEAWDAVLARASLLLHPSRCDSFGLVLLQAWRAGVPVIAAACGGPERLLTHGEDGCLVPPDDPEALAEAASDILGTPQRRNALAAAGRRRLVQGYTWETVWPLWHEQMLGVMTA